MKRVLLTLLVFLLALGVIAAAGFSGYRFGYAQGIQANASRQNPQLHPFDDVNPRGMPMHNFGFDREFRRGFGMGRFPGMGFGFFGVFRLLVPLVILGLIVWLVYWLFNRSGWRLTRTVQAVETPTGSTEITETEVKEESQD